jgi:hypothetical protein
MDKLLARLSEQQAVLNQQNDALRSVDDATYLRAQDHAPSSNSLPITPATDTFPSTAPITRPASATMEDTRQNDKEVLRLKLQLAQAQSHISKLDHELSQTRPNKSEPDTIGSHPQGCATASRDSPWLSSDDTLPDTSDSISINTFDSARGIWGNPRPSLSNTSLPPPIGEPSPGNWFGGRGFGQPFVDHNNSYPHLDSNRGDRLGIDPDILMRPASGRRGSKFDSRMNSPHQFNAPFGGFTLHGGHYENTMGMPMQNGGIPGDPMNAPVGAGHMSMGMYPQYHQQPVGTPLSPHASEFTSKPGWKNEVPKSFAHKCAKANCTQAMPVDGPTYLPPTEPLNYRRLLDRNVNCNWKYIVDKIVCNNDQQASIFLQQKLKVSTPEQKYEIVEAIVAQAYPLMVNRFGNFLVQRCFEHGTPEQVIKIAEAIRGNTLNLSMDPFGCHVVQKAFDSVPESYKAIMVHELLRRIPETVIHRYACHVWQKLFELRWTESPPQIMKFVNEALRGMWHEVALGETGSLVVQNIFENCLEEDKVRLASSLFGSYAKETVAPGYRRSPCQHRHCGTRSVWELVHSAYLRAWRST